jgi:hypothetical protein
MIRQNTPSLNKLLRKIVKLNVMLRDDNLVTLEQVSVRRLLLRAAEAGGEHIHLGGLGA